MQKVSYMGDGTTTEFNFNFPYYESSDIIVTKNGLTATGYSIVGTSAGENADIPYTGGKVVFETAPTSLDSITIARNLPLTRTADYQPTVKINPTTLNQDLNYIMEALKDFSGDLQDFATKYDEIVDKESTTSLLAKISAIHEEIITSDQQISDFEQEISSGNIITKDRFYSYTTNCITDIQQDIKLELSNGTLTLKEGSQVYKPNGSNVFDIINITSDKTLTATTNGTYLVCVYDDSSLSLAYSSHSGTSAPETLSNGLVWYDLTNNKIKRYWGSSWQNALLSLPIAQITVSNNTISSIDKTFNGFGYIGSTIYILPGVKGLIPNGRNSDGTLKNTVMNNTSVHTVTKTVAQSSIITLAQNGGIDGFSVLNYNSETNYNYNSNGNQTKLNAGTVTFGTGGKITSFVPKLALSLKLS